MEKLSQHIKIADMDDVKQVMKLFDIHLDSVKKNDPVEYKSMMDKIESVLQDKHFNEEWLTDSYSRVPKHYNLHTTNMLSHDEFEIDFDKESFNEFDLNFGMNYIYKLFNSVIGDDDNKYLELSLAFLDDINGKAYDFYDKVFK